MKKVSQFSDWIGILGIGELIKLPRLNNISLFSSGCSVLHFREEKCVNLGCNIERKKKPSRYPQEAFKTPSEIQAATSSVRSLRYKTKSSILTCFPRRAFHSVWTGVIVHQRQSSLLRPRSIYVCISPIQASPIHWCDTRGGKKLLKGYYPQSADRPSPVFFSSVDRSVF